jgi:hypothetical protein
MHKLNRGVSSPKLWISSVIFKKTVQRKQSPNGRKIAQSGHPAEECLEKAIIDIITRPKAKRFEN